MIQSGIAPLDAQLGGVAAGRIHLLTGGVGTGKSSACLHFLAAGLAAGESAALLTLDTAAELTSHAAYLGIDIETPLRDGRLIALRFRREFTRRLAGSPSVDWAAEDLRRLLARPLLPRRIAIDPITPFFADGSPIGAAVGAVIEVFDRAGCTALLTCPGHVTDGADRRLDPIIERAATVVAFARHADGAYEMSIARARLAEATRVPIPFRISRAVGLACAPRIPDSAGVMAFPASEVPLRPVADAASRS